MNIYADKDKREAHNNKYMKRDGNNLNYKKISIVTLKNILNKLSDKSELSKS